MKIIEIAKAGKADLMTAALDVLNIDVPANASVSELRAAIMAVHSGPTISLPDAESPVAELPARDVEVKRKPGSLVTFGTKTARLDAKGRVWVMVDATDNDVVPYKEVAVNGENMLIPIGKPVSIPVRYFEAMCNAIVRTPIVTRENEITGWREIPAFPFSVLSPQDDVAA